MICICIVPGCLLFMEHSFPLTSDTDVPISHNESQLSFPYTDSITSSEKIFQFKKKKKNTMFKQI